MPPRSWVWMYSVLFLTVQVNLHVDLYINVANIVRDIERVKVKRVSGCGVGIRKWIGSGVEEVSGCGVGWRKWRGDGVKGKF